MLLGKISMGDRYMISDQARQRAEKSFRQQERAREGREAMAEYEAQARATRKKTARLKALRLAKEAETQNSNTPMEIDDTNVLAGTRSDS
jgi:hypothetical protein